MHVSSMGHARTSHHLVRAVCHQKFAGMLSSCLRVSQHHNGGRHASKSSIVSLAYKRRAGREVREQMFDKVASLLHDLDEGMRPLSVIAPYFPTAYHRKRDRSATSALTVCAFNAASRY